jgi:hypothetical protein
VIRFTEGDYDGAIAFAAAHPDELGELSEALPLIAAAARDPGQWPALEEAIDTTWVESGFGWFLARYPEKTYETLMNGLTTNRSVTLFPWLPYGDFFRESPRFQEFMTQAGVVEIWEKRGWPEQCRPAGDSFQCD